MGLGLNSAANGDRAHPDTGKPACKTWAHIQAGFLLLPLQCDNSALCVMIHLPFLPWLAAPSRYFTRAAPNYQCSSTHNSSAMQSRIIVLFEILYESAEKFEDIAVDKWRHRTSNGPKSVQTCLHHAESNPRSAGDLDVAAQAWCPTWLPSFWTRPQFCPAGSEQACNHLSLAMETGLGPQAFINARICLVRSLDPFEVLSDSPKVSQIVHSNTGIKNGSSHLKLSLWPLNWCSLDFRVAYGVLEGPVSSVCAESGFHFPASDRPGFKKA